MEYQQQSSFTGCMFIVNAKLAIHVFEFEQEVELKTYMEHVNRRNVKMKNKLTLWIMIMRCLKQAEFYAW